MDLQQENPVKPVTFNPNYSLLLTLAPQNFKKSYGFVLTIKEGDTENSIKYEADITYVKTIPDYARLFKIERTTKVYLNDTDPDLLMDQLAAEAGTALYPVVLEVDFDGKFLGINNHQEIKDRWQERKQQILEYFVGDIAAQYCKLMDNTIDSLPQLSWAYRKDMLIGSYFTPIYKSYGSLLRTEDEMKFMLAGNAAPIAYQVTTEVRKNLHDMGLVELVQAGVVTDERSIRDIEEERSFPFRRMTDGEAKPVTGKYAARYLLHPNSNAIRSINAEWELDLTQKRVITVSMHQINADDKVDQLTKGQDQPSLVFLDRDENRGFFSNIFKSLFG